MIEERWRAARNILLVRLDNLGDVLLTTPAFHAVRTSLPEARLTLLASPVGAQVAALDPDIDDVIVYQAPWMDPWRTLPQDDEREQAMISLLRERQFDGAIIFTSFRQSALPAAYLCYLAGIPLRVAASIDGPGSLLTTRHKHPERMMHEVERGLDLVGAIGMQTDEDDLALQVPGDATLAISTMLADLNIDGRPLAVVHPGCSMPARTYPWEMYVQVIDLLIEQLGAFVVVTGMENERSLVAQVLDHIKEEYRPATLALAGVLPFPEFCALIKAADLTITNNTGPMHIAAAVKTPVVALFALTNPPEQWGPWHVPHRQLYHDVPCRICYSRVCPRQHECLRLVSPQTVIDAAIELLRLAQQSEPHPSPQTVGTGLIASDLSLVQEQQKNHPQSVEKTTNAVGTRLIASDLSPVCEPQERQPILSHEAALERGVEGNGDKSDALKRVPTKDAINHVAAGMAANSERTGAEADGMNTVATEVVPTEREEVAG